MAVGFSRGILNPALFRFRSPLPKLRTQPATVVYPPHQTKRVTGQLSPAQLRFDEDVVWVDNVQPPESLMRAFGEPSETFSPNFISLANTSIGRNRAKILIISVCHSTFLPPTCVLDIICFSADYAHNNTYIDEIIVSQHVGIDPHSLGPFRRPLP